MVEYEIPWWASVEWIFCIFAVSTVALHCSFVWFGSLSSINWKRVDYIWVLMAFFGILGTIEQSRAMISIGNLSIASVRAKTTFESINSVVELGRSVAVCRTFQRTEFSPPEEKFQDLQKGFDAQCEWFKKLADGISKIDSTIVEKIDLSKLTPTPPAGGDPQIYRMLRESISLYNKEVSSVIKLKKLAEVSPLKEFLLMLGPLVLSIALALRITKISGEIKLEKMRNAEA